ncbi:MAG: hypothetical protein ACPGXK_02500 [Phycisphaerae bacterium]
MRLKTITSVQIERHHDEDPIVNSVLEPNQQSRRSNARTASTDRQGVTQQE